MGITMTDLEEDREAASIGMMMTDLQEDQTTALWSWISTPHYMMLHPRMKSHRCHK